MKNKLAGAAAKAAQGAEKALTVIGDLNGDGKVDKADFEIALARTKAAASEVADEAADLGRAVLRSEMTRDVATGAAVGAAIAIPVPVIGPSIGALAGAGLGLYKNLKSKGAAPPAQAQLAPGEAMDALTRLGELREQGVLTQQEFDAQKRKLLSRT